MRAIFLLSLSTLIVTSAIAQSQPTMLSQSRYKIASDGQPVLEDSLTHTHSGGRVSYGLPEVELTHSPNDGVYNADESVRVYKNFSTGAFFLVDRMYRVFNASGQVTEYHEQVKSLGTLKETFKEMYHYDQSQQCDTQWWNTAQTAARLIRVYQGNKLMAGVYQNLNQSTKLWEFSGVDSFIANGTDSFFIKYANSGGMYQQEWHHYIRDANSRVLVDSFKGNYIGTGVMFYTYDPGGRKIKDSVFSGLDYNFSYKADYLYDNNGNMVSCNVHLWDKNAGAYTQRSLDTMEHNAVNQLISVETYHLVNNTWKPRPGSFWRYYYYGFPTGISDMGEDKILRLYPVPATNYINLDITFDKPERFSVRIMDLQGRIIRQWEEAEQASYEKKIQLDGMTAGSYIVQVMSEGRNITRQFSVIQ